MLLLRWCPFKLGKETLLAVISMGRFQSGLDPSSFSLDSTFKELTVVETKFK
jgi:hypothetical protein